MKDRNSIIEDIKNTGLHIDGRGNIYGPEYKLYVSLRGGLWQKPNEIADLLMLLQTQTIRTFLNIGTFNGATFNFISDFLNTIGDTVCITVDPYPHGVENSEPLYKIYLVLYESFYYNFSFRKKINICLP